MNNLSFIRSHLRQIVVQFVLLFLPIALFFSSLAFLFYYRDTRTALDTLQRIETDKISSQMQLLSSRFEGITASLELLALQPEIAAYLNSPTPDLLQAVKDKLLLFSSGTKIFHKVELLDTSGQQQAVVVSKNQVFTLLAEQMLKNYNDAAFFQKTLALTGGQINTTSLKSGKTHNTAVPAPELLYSTPIISETGLVLGVLAVAHPISLFLDDLKAVSQSSASETFLLSSTREILGSSAVGSKARHYLQMNPAQTTFLKAEWDTIKQHIFGQFQSQNGLFTFSTVCPFQTNSPYTNDTNKRNCYENGTTDYLWKEVSYIPVNDISALQQEASNRILPFYIIALCITAAVSFLFSVTAIHRRIAQKTILEKAEELRAISDTAADGIIAFDRKGKVVHWNRGAEELFQYPSQEMINSSITLLFATLTKRNHQGHIAEFQMETVYPTTETAEMVGKRKDDTTFPLEASFSSFEKESGWQTVGIFRDISDRRTVEKERRRADKFESLNVLSEGIAHDFNDLLSAILGSITLINRQKELPTASQVLIEYAEKAAGRAKRLTRQLLFFSQDGGAITRKTTAIEPILHDAIAHALHGSPVISNFSIPKDLLLVDIDVDQINQVISNITINAKQAIIGNGAISVICRNVIAEETEMLPEKFTGKYVEIALHDTGSGIPPQHAAKMFDPYFTTKKNSSGLGLTIAAAIVDRHDGYITQRSQENRGSTFYLFLPAAVDQHLQVEKCKTAVTKKHLHIMVVEDEEILLAVTEKTLSYLGHECIPVSSGREAIEMYRQLYKTGTPVDCVIMDLSLADGIGGKETAGAIWDMHREAKIIASSGYSNDPLIVNYQDYGFCAAIAKPYEIEELSDIINAIA
ncbi:MAG: hypothetical protein CSA26_10695 [Desulfobacterales bacterium]|nr:MAG: hypothetical protein CSA26_10695 [Desulfobacterales bacterium]